jgi:hypothetical protein
VNLASRSRIRNRNCSARSPRSMSRLRAPLDGQYPARVNHEIAQHRARATGPPPPWRWAGQSPGSPGLRCPGVRAHVAARSGARAQERAAEATDRRFGHAECGEGVPTPGSDAPQWDRARTTSLPAMACVPSAALIPVRQEVTLAESASASSSPVLLSWRQTTPRSAGGRRELRVNYHRVCGNLRQ